MPSKKPKAIAKLKGHASARAKTAGASARAKPAGASSRSSRAKTAGASPGAKTAGASPGAMAAEASPRAIARSASPAQPTPPPTPARRERAVMILDRLKERFPDAKIELDHDEEDAWQLLVAVVLSAQSTDKGVNKVTPALFQAFPDVHAFAQATPAQLEPYIKSLGLYRNKAKALVGAAKEIVDKHAGVVPRAREILEGLPGVGKKSAAVIVANAFGEPAIAVDTHVGRVTRRLGLTKNDDPWKVEQDLTALLPRDRLLEAHHTFIWHGRRICDAKKPKCSECPVEKLCHKVGVTVQA